MHSTNSITIKNNQEIDQYITYRGKIPIDLAIRDVRNIGTQNFQNISIEVFTGKDFRSRHDIYKLWYEVYCLEMGRDLEKADKKNLLLQDYL